MKVLLHGRGIFGPKVSFKFQVLVATDLLAFLASLATLASASTPVLTRASSLFLCWPRFFSVVLVPMCCRAPATPAMLRRASSWTALSLKLLHQMHDHSSDTTEGMQIVLS